MIIQLQFSEIMGCANLFQIFLTLAVYCVSTPTGARCVRKKKKQKNYVHFIHQFK
jgi:hypothetical protein